MSLNVKCYQIWYTVIITGHQCLWFYLLIAHIKCKKNIFNVKYEKNIPFSISLHCVCLTSMLCFVFSLGSVDLRYSDVLYKDLSKGLEGLLLNSFLHLVYLVTPYDFVSQIKPDWMIYFSQVRHSHTTYNFSVTSRDGNHQWTPNTVSRNIL